METPARISLLPGLPPRVVEALFRLGGKYREKGVRLFVFGSVASGGSRLGSDLDLGILWKVEPSKSILAELYDDVLELPTIRKIDLVDMSRVDPGFRNQVLSVDPVFLDQN